MTRSILCFALLFFAFTTFAQQATQKPQSPCATPLLELYDEQNKGLPEGEIPTGKVAIRIKKDPRCQDNVTYEVAKVYVVLVSGVRPIAETTIQGNVLDTDLLKNNFGPGDRILFDVHELKYKIAEGKTGNFSLATNWFFKKSE